MSTRPRPGLSIRPIVLAIAVLASSLPRAEAEQWQPARGNEPTLGDLLSGLLALQGGGVAALLLLAASLAALLVGLQLLGSRS